MQTDEEPEVIDESEIVDASKRRRLPDTRESITHKFVIDTYPGYLTVGLYPDGTPGEIFITMAKQGSTINGLLDSFGISVSLGLQYGIPLNVFIEKFKHHRFQPSGFTRTPDIRLAKSIVDYIARWLDIQFNSKTIPPDTEDIVYEEGTAEGSLDSPICSTCGALTVLVGNCHLCSICGTSGGCS